MLEGALPADELQDTKQAVLQHEVLRKERAHRSAFGTSSGSTARRVDRLKAVPEYEAYTVNDLSQCLLAVRGCTLGETGRALCGGGFLPSLRAAFLDVARMG